MAERTSTRRNGREPGAPPQAAQSPSPRPAPPEAQAGDAMPPGQRIAYLEALVRTMQEQLADANAKAAHAHTLARLNEDAAKALDTENRQLKAQLAAMKPPRGPEAKQ